MSGSKNSGASTEAPAGKDSRKTRRHDWEAIERDYRTGKFTLRELEAKHGAGYADISRRAKKEGWAKDLREAVKRATDAKLVAQVAQHAQQAEQQSTTAVVQAMAEQNTQVILRHRSDLREARDVVMGLLGEVRGAMLLDQEQELLAEILAGDGAEPKDVNEARRVVAKAVGLGGRVASMKALAEAITKLHGGERTAFGLDAEPGDAPPASVALTGELKISPSDAYLKLVQGR